MWKKKRPTYRQNKNARCRLKRKVIKRGSFRVDPAAESSATLVYSTHPSLPGLLLAWMGFLLPPLLSRTVSIEEDAKKKPFRKKKKKTDNPYLELEHAWSIFEVKKKSSIGVFVSFFFFSPPSSFFDTASCPIAFLLWIQCAIIAAGKLFDRCANQIAYFNGCLIDLVFQNLI